MTDHQAKLLTVGRMLLLDDPKCPTCKGIGTVEVSGHRGEPLFLFCKTCNATGLVKRFSGLHDARG
jgi:hypothetical protein